MRWVAYGHACITLSFRKFLTHMRSIGFYIIYRPLADPLLIYSHLLVEMSRKEWVQGTFVAVCIFTALVISREYLGQASSDPRMDSKADDRQPTPLHPVIADPVPPTPVLQPKNLTRPYCMTKYGTRSFINPKPQTTPPSLWTFPGSGNTWTRLLIEYATGTPTFSLKT